MSELGLFGRELGDDVLLLRRRELVGRQGSKRGNQ
jgi:hypothetical protein